MDTVELLIDEIRKELELRLCDESFSRIIRCIELLSEDQLWHAPNEHTNSVANLVLHLNGNIRQWLLDGFFGISYTRIRENEFSARKSHTKEELISIIKSLLVDIQRVINIIAIDMLLRRKTIQSHFDVSGYAIISHVIEHASYHTGQIAQLTKIMLDTQVGFYEDLEL